MRTQKVNKNISITSVNVDDELDGYYSKLQGRPKLKNLQLSSLKVSIQSQQSSHETLPGSLGGNVQPTISKSRADGKIMKNGRKSDRNNSIRRYKAAT